MAFIGAFVLYNPGLMYEGAILKPFPMLYIPETKKLLFGHVERMVLHILSKLNPKGILAVSP